MSQEGDKTNIMSRNKSAHRNLKRHPSFRTKLEEMKEVKKLHISEENVSYYDDEKKTFKLGVIKTLKPQFMYDAALARKKDEERASRERYEDIRRRFWKKWAPPGEDVKPQKVLEKVRPFDLDLMKATSPEKEAILNESSAMYKECVNRAARDAIVFASAIKPPSCRMKRLPNLLKTLNARIERSETIANNLFVQCSETSSVENVLGWIKQLKPFVSGAQLNKRVSISARRARTSIPMAQIKKSKVLSAQARRKENAKAARDQAKSKKHRSKKLNAKNAILGKNILKGLTQSAGVSLPLHGNFSIISMEQLLSYGKPPVYSGSATALRRKVNPTKKAQELKEEIEMVKNLPMNIFPEGDSKLSCKVDPAQFASVANKHWQERRLYYQKQQGIDYDINYNNACLKRLCYVPPHKGTAGRH